MNKIYIALLFLFSFVCIFAEQRFIKPGTYDSLPANPGDQLIFFPGVYTLPNPLQLVTNVQYLGNQSYIKGSLSWEGVSGVTISDFTFSGTVLSFDDNDTNIIITGNTFYVINNSPSSAIIDMFSCNTVLIANNTFYGLNEQQLGISVAQSTDIEISNNTIYSASVEFQIYSTDNNVNVYLTGVRLFHNCFYNVSGEAILIFVGIPGPTFRVEILNNTINSYRQHLPDFTRAINIQLQDQPFVVSGNYLSPAEASGALCDFCTPIVIETTAVQTTSTITANTIGGNAWAYYVQCFADGDFNVPVTNNFFYGNVTPPVSSGCGTFPNTIGPRSAVPPAPPCF